MSNNRGPFYQMSEDNGYILEPYLDEAGLHFPTTVYNNVKNEVYDQYIPRKILYQLIDEYFKDKEGK